jgi:hypothetical protein
MGVAAAGMFMNLLFDMTILSIIAFRSASTGIDRVEHTCTKELHNVSETTGVFTTPLFVGALRISRALDLSRRAERAWRLGRGPEDAVFQQVQGWLEAPPDTEAKRAQRFSIAAKSDLNHARGRLLSPLRLHARADRLNRWIGRGVPKPAACFAVFTRNSTRRSKHLSISARSARRHHKKPKARNSTNTCTITKVNKVGPLRPTADLRTTRA